MRPASSSKLPGVTGIRCTRRTFRSSSLAYAKAKLSASPGTTPTWTMGTECWPTVATGPWATPTPRHQISSVGGRPTATGQLCQRPAATQSAAGRSSISCWHDVAGIRPRLHHSLRHTDRAPELPALLAAPLRQTDHRARRPPYMCLSARGPGRASPGRHVDTSARPILDHDGDLHTGIVQGHP